MCQLCTSMQAGLFLDPSSPTQHWQWLPPHYRWSMILSQCKSQSVWNSDMYHIIISVSDRIQTPRPWHLDINPVHHATYCTTCLCLCPDFYMSSFNFSSDHLFWTFGFLFNTSDSYYCWSVVVIVDSNVTSICLLVIPSHPDVSIYWYCSILVYK